MKNVVSKVIILALAIIAAISGVLFFIRYVVNPPEDISAIPTAEHVFNPYIENLVASYNPDSLGLKEAEFSYDALVDCSTVFREDELINDNKVFDKVIAELSEKFTRRFLNWSIGKFNKSTWNKGDHEVMLRLIAKMRKVSIDNGSKKALSQKSLLALTEIENTIYDYRKAWSLARQTTFIDYQNVASVLAEARTYLEKAYLCNCTRLVNALNVIGEKQEISCFCQLSRKVDRLQYYNNYGSRNEYEVESKRVYGLIKEFHETQVFGVSTTEHANDLAERQDEYDRNARYYWMNSY